MCDIGKPKGRFARTKADRVSDIGQCEKMVMLNSQRIASLAQLLIRTKQKKNLRKNGGTCNFCRPLLV